MASLSAIIFWSFAEARSSLLCNEAWCELQEGPPNRQMHMGFKQGKPLPLTVQRNEGHDGKVQTNINMYSQGGGFLRTPTQTIVLKMVGVRAPVDRNGD
jgi:hypothetical protein